MAALADRVRALLALTGPLGAGFRVLLLRLVERFGWKTVLIGIGVLLYAANRYRTWIPYGIALTCAAAWMHAPNQADEPDDETAGEGPAEPDPEDAPDLPAALASLSNGGHNHVLLTTLSERLGDATTKATRARLAEASIAVRDGVRAPDGNGPGVHRADLPPPSPEAEAADEERCLPSSAANANANNTLRVESREGMTIINDPADRHRTHSLKKH